MKEIRSNPEKIPQNESILRSSFKLQDPFCHNIDFLKKTFGAILHFLKKSSNCFFSYIQGPGICGSNLDITNGHFGATTLHIVNYSMRKPFSKTDAVLGLYIFWSIQNSNPYRNKKIIIISKKENSECANCLHSFNLNSFTVFFIVLQSKFLRETQLDVYKCFPILIKSGHFP